MPQVPSLDEQWHLFMRRSDLENAPSHQRYEMEYAFKCGAISIMVNQRDVLAVLSEENGVAAIQSWMKEFGVFIHDRVRKWNMMQQANNDPRQNN